MSTLAALGNHIPVTTQKLTATTANGTKIQLPGSTRLPIQIGTHTILHQFHIAADHECPAPLLLGSDFIRSLNETGLALSMDLHNQTLTIGSDILDLVQIHHIALVPTKTYDVRIKEDTIIARRTNNIVPAKIDGILQPMCKAFLIEDNLRPMDDIFVVGRSLVSPSRDGSCFINILNPSNKELLHQHTKSLEQGKIQIHALDIPHLPFQPTLHYSVYSTDTYHERLPITPTISRLHDSVYSTNFYDEHLPVIPPIPYPHDSVYSTKLHHKCPPTPPPIPCALDGTTEFPGTTTTLHNAYVPPEADWESRLPSFPAPLVDYDIANDIDLSRAALNNDQKNRLLDIIRFHANAFVGPDGHLGHYKGPIRHRIDLVEDAQIPARKIYHVLLEKRQEIEKQITQMLKDGIIRESSSPFCAPIVLVKKREANTWRFTIDFRGLNAITKPQQSTPTSKT
ncbi:hypothetical protein Aduo_018887 [Ancylostoma duodenale]